ncbi:MAG: glycosyltransferase family 39 protein [Patescibacteria group bacterium]
MQKRVFFFLILIIATAAFFRWWHFSTIPPGLYPDEAMNGNNALEAIKTGNYKVFYPENNGREGLFINIQSLSVRIFGNEPWALRLVSTIFGILTVLGIFFLTRELFKKDSVALFASFFLATSFWHINFSRIGFRAIMAPAFLVFSFWLLFKTINKTKNANSNNQETNSENWLLSLGDWLLPILSGLLFGLGFHSYIAYRIAPLLLVLPFLLLIKNKNYKPIILFLLGAFIAGLPLGFYYLNNPQDFFGRTSQVSIFSTEFPLYELGKNIFLTIGMFFFSGDSNWRHNFAGAPELWWPLAISFLIGFIISIKKLRVMSYGLLIAWFVIMLLPVIISSEGIPHALRAIVIIPPTMIIAALGFNWLIEKINQQLDARIIKFPDSKNQLLRIKKEGKILIFAVLFAIGLNTFSQYFLRWAYNPNVYYAFAGNYAEIGRYLNKNQNDAKKYVIINANGVDVRGVPMPSQTIMFLTDTFLQEQQRQKNIYYILPQNLDIFIEVAKKEKNIEIYMLEIDNMLRKKLADNISGLTTYPLDGVLMQKK